MTFRYIGSKARLTMPLAHASEAFDDGSGRFVDAFSGTGAVAELAADQVRSREELVDNVVKLLPLPRCPAFPRKMHICIHEPSHIDFNPFINGPLMPARDFRSAVQQGSRSSLPRP